MIYDFLSVGFGCGVDYTAECKKNGIRSLWWFEILTAFEWTEDAESVVNACTALRWARKAGPEGLGWGGGVSQAVGCSLGCSVMMIDVQSRRGLLSPLSSGTSRSPDRRIVAPSSSTAPPAGMDETPPTPASPAGRARSPDPPPQP
ncbi:hypothetical protein SKAU_G00081890 [Synaphobranchus kaupii]|uniref:Uncharacterized protein n=1 Tax=Synaphobranchus kaupii TaxID=118154 RepID=A0A9Q1J5K4_SYNKA|nr:hypothetical protein SKAU_G00081890 [Synaphobranchus kaupii]